MRLLITGGSGALGSALVKHVLTNDLVEWVAVYSRGEHRQLELANEIGPDLQDRLRFFLGDVRDVSRLRVAMWGATHVIHAAALKVVPWLEYNPDEGIKTNVIGAMNVVECALRSPGLQKVVGVSSDKACSPTNLYGATKLCAEKLFTAADGVAGEAGPRFNVVRYGNVTGSTGSVVPFWREKAILGLPLPITYSGMTRFWMTLPHAVALVLGELHSKTYGGDVVIPKLPSYNLPDLAAAVWSSTWGDDAEPAPASPETGIRPGEKVHESMVSIDEAPWTTDQGDTYRIHRSASATAGGDAGEIIRGEAVDPDFYYSSGENDEWLTARTMTELLKTIP